MAGALNVNELDFSLIKANIKLFLSTQSEFTDYDFDGSGMNILIDLLAYSTHYMGIYGNMTFNEMFLTTGLLRASVVSKATELGYVPSQTTASVATITISVASAFDVIIPKGTRFQGVNDLGDGYSFTTLSNYTLSSNGTIATGDVPIYQGTLVTDAWLYTEGSGDRYILENENVDVKHMTVNIIENESSTDLVEWLSFNNIVNISADTETYFYRETVESKVEIYFGNGVIGKALINDNIIQVENLVNNGSVSNDIQLFTLLNSAGIKNTNNDTFSVGDFTVDTSIKSAEGTDKESIGQIKHNAPLYYQTQNRTVTENDYTAILLKEFDYIQAMNVWGGEENDPPLYGRVMIAIKPNSGTELSDNAKTDILTYLDTVKVTGIIPVLIDPSYSYIDIVSYVKYNAHLTTKLDSDIVSVVEITIDDHFTTNLYAFNSTLKYSELVTDIDLSDDSIFSNYVEMILRNDMIVGASAINTPFTYTISFNNPVKPETFTMKWITSSSQNMEIKDDGKGMLYLYEDGSLRNGTVGSIDYNTGVFVLVDFNPILPAADTIKIYADPATFDIETIQNNILLKGDVTVNVETVII